MGTLDHLGGEGDEQVQEGNVDYDGHAEAETRQVNLRSSACAHVECVLTCVFDIDVWQT